MDNTPNQAWDGWGQAANECKIQQIQAADYIRKMAEEVVEKDASLSEEERTAYTELAEKYEKEEAQLRALVQEKMWSSEDSFYYNLDENGNFTSIATPTGLWSLAAGLPSRGAGRSDDQELRAEFRKDVSPQWIEYCVL